MRAVINEYFLAFIITVLCQAGPNHSYDEFTKFVEDTATKSLNRSYLIISALFLHNEWICRTRNREAKIRRTGESAYLNREIKSEQFASMAVVQAAIPLAMYTSIGPELSELTQRQAITTGKRLSKSLNHYRADVTSVQHLNNGPTQQHLKKGCWIQVSQSVLFTERPIASH